MRTLYYGDNLDILQRYVPDDSVDLVYLDPPFNSAQTYNAFFQEKDGSAAASQIKAFEDTWQWNQQSEAVYRGLTEQVGKVKEVLEAFMTFLGRNDMMAYLTMMAPRLVELRRVLKTTGSLYLHCDPTASHYLKLLLDAVMGADNYQNEIVWKRTSAHSSAKRYGPNRDTILFYSKSETKTWNSQRLGYSDDYLQSKYGNEDERGRYSLGDLTAAGVRHGESGKCWRGIDPSAKGVHWKFGVGRLEQLEREGRIYWPKETGMPRYKRYLSEVGGVVLQEIWDDIAPINSMAKERLGYPTQKPVALLERIIQASSNPGDVVLDPFCGCGTTIDAAEKLGRQWIGIDITALATSLIKNRLLDTYGSRLKFVNGVAPEPRLPGSAPGTNPPGALPEIVRIIGEPTTPNEASRLAEQDKYQFQWWALGLVGARPVEQKKGADHGIDGKIFFRDDPRAAKPEQIIIQVKAGKAGVDHVRDLRGVLDREKAAMGVLITLQEASQAMKVEAASFGFYAHKLNGQKYPRLQIRTVREFLDGHGIERPTSAAAVDETFKRAPKTKAGGHGQHELGIR